MKQGQYLLMEFKEAATSLSPYNKIVFLIMREAAVFTSGVETYKWLEKKALEMEGGRETLWVFVGPMHPIDKFNNRDGMVSAMQHLVEAHNLFTENPDHIHVSKEWVHYFHGLQSLLGVLSLNCRKLILKH